MLTEAPNTAYHKFKATSTNKPLETTKCDKRGMNRFKHAREGGIP